MSGPDNPFDARRRPVRERCSCGLHMNDAEHARAAVLQWRCELAAPTGPRYDGVVAARVLREMFPPRRDD